MTSTSDPLVRLAAQVRDDLDKIAHPRPAWLLPKRGPDGQPALDVLVVGAGQSGLAIAIGLFRAQVRNIRVVDKAPYGREGPWLTYARMRTLRSPKDYTGPDLDLPSLTYQSWHEARFGTDDWAALKLIPRELWIDYLIWVRETTALPIDNEVEVVDVAPAAELIAVTLRSATGTETVHTRKLVLATGQEGAGAWWMPDFIRALPTPLRAHAADPIDFATLKGKTVAVLGAGASAFDNAATALEAGAAGVHLFCRRAEPQTVQPYRWLTFAGFLRHLGDLDDAWRWRFMQRILGLREGFPQETWDRCARHENFVLHTGLSWTGAKPAGAGVEIATSDGPFQADFLICGTGIDMDFASRPELARFAANIATWADRYTPPPSERDDRLGRYPYLNDDYSFAEKNPGTTPWIADIHLFAIASTMSFGPSGSSINAMSTAVPALVRGVTRGLFRKDVARHWAELQAYDVSQAVLRRPPAADARAFHVFIEAYPAFSK
jgi:cation diffusion facilitator CzcD-associated flavoprotein CzcO